MRLFIEQGYDKTSLREIAEQVGVTKAALYYHFRTKDDIVRVAFAGYWEQIGAILDWYPEQPAGMARLEGFVDRIQQLFDSDAALVMRFGQANPTVMAREGADMDFTDLVPRLVTLLAGDRPSAEDALRPPLAFGALLMASVEDNPLSLRGSQAVRSRAARKLALELLAPLA
ncbi:TetR/AcrR family transcriptional regulator [Microlunatus elymi]|nr:TetR/AcrR family transcriptional regulator [Microlunatus elymi]